MHQQASSSEHAVGGILKFHECSFFADTEMDLGYGMRTYEGIHGPTKQQILLYRVPCPKGAIVYRAPKYHKNVLRFRTETEHIEFATCDWLVNSVAQEQSIYCVQENGYMYTILKKPLFLQQLSSTDFPLPQKQCIAILKQVGRILKRSQQKSEQYCIAHGLVHHLNIFLHPLDGYQLGICWPLFSKSLEREEYRRYLYTPPQKLANGTNFWVQDKIDYWNIGVLMLHLSCDHSKLANFYPKTDQQIQDFLYECQMNKSYSEGWRALILKFMSIDKSHRKDVGNLNDFLTKDSYLQLKMPERKTNIRISTLSNTSHVSQIKIIGKTAGRDKFIREALEIIEKLRYVSQCTDADMLLLLLLFRVMDIDRKSLMDQELRQRAKAEYRKFGRVLMEVTAVRKIMTRFELENEYTIGQVLTKVTNNLQNVSEPVKPRVGELVEGIQKRMSAETGDKKFMPSLEVSER